MSFNGKNNNNSENVQTTNEGTNDTFNLANLSLEVTLHIFSFLTTQDITRLAQCSSTLKELAYHDYLWSEFYRHVFGSAEYRMMRQNRKANWEEEIPVRIYFKERWQRGMFLYCGNALLISPSRTCVHSDSKKFASWGNSPQTVLGEVLPYGSHYFTLQTTGSYVGIGIAGATISTEPQSLSCELLHHSSGCCIYYFTGLIYCNGRREALLPIFNNNDIIGLKIKVTEDTVHLCFLKNQQYLHATEISPCGEGPFRLCVVLGTRFHSEANILSYELLPDDDLIVDMDDEEDANSLLFKYV